MLYIVIVKDADKTQVAANQLCVVATLKHHITTFFLNRL